MLKKISLFFAFFVFLSMTSACSFSEQSVVDTSSIDGSEYVVATNDFVNAHNLIDENAPGVLTEDEIAGLTLMREEEKLARDVYSALYQKWNLKIFDNIAGSEQTHTDAVKTLLDLYQIEDPVKNDKMGVFSSPELASLYQTLVASGEKSLLDALIVGATVEDLDINDLDKLTAQTNNQNIIAVYDNLNRGSRNHLRAFVKQITRNGGEYAPQYITNAKYLEIVNGAQENGSGRNQ